MILLDPERAAALRDWFVPDRPGPLVGLHVLHTGNGACFVDRWPDPRAIMAETADNFSLRGAPDALRADDVAIRIAGFVDAPEAFVPLLTSAFTDVRAWDRVVLEQPAAASVSHGQPGRNLVRRLAQADAHYLWALSPADRWIWKTWGGPAGLAASGYGWGGFVDGVLRSLACTFFVGDGYEDVGVVTDSRFRGRGLSAACAGALCEDIRQRGRVPSWTTSTDNVASLRVAEKLGFAIERHDRLYVVGMAIPEPARIRNP